MSVEKYFETDECSEELEAITVDQGEGWKLAKAPDAIETTNLGPCIGVIIYDSESKQALVGHFVDPEIDDFTGMLDEALQRFSKKNKLKIYIGGGAPELDDASSFDYDKERKAFVKKQLADYGFKKPQITTRYQNQMQTTILRIDTSTGDVNYGTKNMQYDEY